MNYVRLERRSHGGSITSYQPRVLEHMIAALSGLGPFPHALDFGAGSGWYARHLTDRAIVQKIEAIDVQARPKTLHLVSVYDGITLPFTNGHFPLVYAVDVLHHCPDPAAAIRECLRVCGGYFLVKDHTYQTSFGWLSLAALDELGNRRLGVPSVYKYQRGFNWAPIISAEGFSLVNRKWPLRCNGSAVGTVTDRLQFLDLWKRG